MTRTSAYLFAALALAAVLLLALPGCDDGGDLEEGVPFKIVLKAKYDGQDMVLNTPYAHADEQQTPIYFTRLQFYVSDISLWKNGRRTILNEIMFVDLDASHADAASAAQGFALDFEKVPVGHYDAISFGIGVSDDLNATKPNIYSSTHPLGSTANYWEAWTSYIFTRLEGRADTIADPNGVFETSFLYHTGGDNLFREVVLSDLDFSVAEEGNGRFTLFLDMENILGREGDVFNLRTNSISHTNPADPKSVELSARVADNLRDAFRAGE